MSENANIPSGWKNLFLGRVLQCLVRTFGVAGGEQQGGSNTENRLKPQTCKDSKPQPDTSTWPQSQPSTVHRALTRLLHVGKTDGRDGSVGTAGEQQSFINREQGLYLNHVYPLSNVEEALLTGDVIQQQHAVRTPEIRLGDAAEPDRRNVTMSTGVAAALNPGKDQQQPHLSCPAVSHNCSKTGCPSMISVFIWKSTPALAEEPVSGK